jgi:hypothetical protein
MEVPWVPRLAIAGRMRALMVSNRPLGKGCESYCLFVFTLYDF